MDKPILEQMLDLAAQLESEGYSVKVDALESYEKRPCLMITVQPYALPQPFFKEDIDSQLFRERNFKAILEQRQQHPRN